MTPPPTVGMRPQNAPSIVPIAPSPERAAMPMDSLHQVSQMVTPKPHAPFSPSPITPIASEPHGKEHRDKEHRAKQQGVGLHLPGKLDLAELAMQFKDVNLIPGEFSLRSWRSIIQSLVLSVVAVVAVSAISYALLNVQEGRITSRTAQIDADILKFKNDILFYKKQEPIMTSIGTRIELVKQLLGTHIYWTNFFTLLEKYTLPDVNYDGISATPSGKLSLSAHGTNFETVSKVLRLLSSPDAAEFVSSVAITGAHQAIASDGATRVDFVIELTLNPNLFYYRDGQK
ncbi:MAG: hypothetical protein Q8O19_06775 [Rectinemataceae bacterium]|nr:hypothetical protein [Rectinemataceae bacterium]